MPYRLLTEYEKLFSGQAYLHRNSSLGDYVAMHLYEDLLDLGNSEKLGSRVQAGDWVVNVANKRQGIRARRGDGTFGELVAGENAQSIPGFGVARGIVATVEIGVEVKILAKAMIKQIDRVCGDLIKQVSQFQRGSGNPICVAVVGINHAASTVGYEGDRSYRTDGKANRHPIQEAAKAEARLMDQVATYFDEFVILHYAATNEAPFPFHWVNPGLTQQNYGSALVRISREYDRRF